VSAILYIVATPIGNLEDITLRALRVLREAGVIACEDTRRTRKLLEHFGIARPLVSYHEHNEARRASELVRKLEGGVDVALVSDAGTPLISDPGYRLVSAAIQAGITVTPIPGASAAVTALAASGLPTDSFRFCGFLPAKAAERRRTLERLRGETCTLIWYEAPHRVLETLADIEARMGGRPVVAARELTKIHEEFLRGTAGEIRAQLMSRPRVLGEIVLLVGQAPARREDWDTPVEEAVRLLEQKGVGRMEAIKQVARSRGLAKREVYRRLV
jgi:16S rRNA (cytidine1402-2'-O)-methyltransferase